MPARYQLQQILNDPASTTEERSIAQAELDGLDRDHDPVTRLEAKLLQSTGKAKLGAIDYHDIHKFCTAYGWREAHVMDLWWKWLFGPHGE
jgi:hypothetical protein